ncbi:hypothetical protein CXF97_22745 [Pseudomonas sp. Choline-02u-1]|nr:hypothetical protein CXF97_22745 [Pseudomonas sp. Choline-02u-1]
MDKRTVARHCHGRIKSLIPVGAGLPAKASAHPTSLPTDPPPSRASPLPQWNELSHPFSFQHDLCGSGLAREGVGTSNIAAN